VPRGRTKHFSALHLVSTVGALALAMAFEHWAIHRDVVIPVMNSAGLVYPWMWACLFVPELIVCFVAGWPLEGWRDVGGYALLATVHRLLWGWALARGGEPGHGEVVQSAAEFAFSVPVVFACYVVAFWLSSESGHEPGPEPSGER
jgi:hypothetical protein